ncbi:MAG TPA: hypothetical protein VK458_01245, partial [Myxococcaceae bacterium]|nr:hypothetical protein [Myxococcaceae bacterium]
YRLVMGKHPPPIDVQEDEEGTWRLICPDPRPLLESNPRVEPRLREVIVRLLSEAPEARGTAAQAAKELEAIEQERVPRARAWRPWLAVAAAAGCAVLLWNVATVPEQRQQRASDFQSPDAGTSAVGDNSPTQPRAPGPPAQEKKPVAQEPLPEPRVGQIRTDKRGQCPGRRQVPINGGCWFEVLGMSAEECVENGSVRFEGRCYGPALAPSKKPRPTSSPPEAR